MSRYAVFDLETTGLSAAHHHRVVEVAVVLVDDDGTVVYEWETLVNPQRDVGATAIHGLSAIDVYDAPTFDQIAPELEDLLRGRVPVAHNLSFDAPFLTAEFRRVGYDVPLSPTAGLCTMRLASRYLPAGPRTLEACCSCIGCSITSAHAALDDARATARLLRYYLQHDDDFLGSWTDVIATAQSGTWPAIPASPLSKVTRRSAAAADTQHFLGRLASRSPRSEIHPEANGYLALLDRVLLDRCVSRHEADELVSAARTMGLSREEALALHRLYLTGLGRLALEDGGVTDQERLDLESVAVALGLPTEDIDVMLQADAPVAADCIVGGFVLKSGDTVVFTGEAPCIERSDLAYQATSLGLRATSAVSGKTTLLVTADPDSLSGKARRARDLAIPIVDYATYFKMLDSIG